MGIDKKLLEILCCPVTKVPVKRLPKAKLKLVKRKRQARGVETRAWIQKLLTSF